jgi:DNA-binding transcriptional regulator YiaG
VRSATRIRPLRPGRDDSGPRRAAPGGAADAAPTLSLAAAGDLLRRARQSARMSQQFLGVLLGTTQQTVSRWEQGLGAPEEATQEALRQILPLPADLWVGADRFAG